MMLLLAFVLNCLLIVLVEAIPRWHQGRLIHSSESIISPDTADKYAKEIVQDLDHFNRQISVTFKQRYFLNDTFWTGSSSGAPVFLCVGGEGPPLDWTVLVSSVHCNDMVELAPKYGALMVALEHRYYGPSNPFGKNLSTSNLQWLNTEQALGDIAAFHSFISSTYSLTSDNLWVTWGGSYPGMLAALARLRYPQLIHAAVSSSSPLEAVVDFPGYNNVVANSMAAEDVGGSEKCLSAIKEGHAIIKEKLQTADGRAFVEKLFNVCTPGSLDDVKNQEQFCGDGVVYLPVQSNDPSCSTAYCDIASICVLMTDESAGSPIERLAKLSSAQSSGSCVSVSYDKMIATLSNPLNPERSWLYQTCTEWGFYQTCEEGSQCPYTQGLHTIEVDYDICLQAFGVPSSAVDKQIAYTNAVYGGRSIQGSRILFPSGQIDPWQASSVLEAPNSEEPTLWVVGASHHFWTHPSLPTDSAEVNKARQDIWAQVGEWLN